MSEEINEKPIILITNDDGITAPGIRSLVEAVQDLVGPEPLEAVQRLVQRHGARHHYWCSASVK